MSLVAVINSGTMADDDQYDSPAGDGVGVQLSENDQGELANVQSVRDTCDYITRVISNFNNQYATLDSESKECITNMNSKVLNLFSNLGISNPTRKDVKFETGTFQGNQETVGTSGEPVPSSRDPSTSSRIPHTCNEKSADAGVSTGSRDSRHNTRDSFPSRWSAPQDGDDSDSGSSGVSCSRPRSAHAVSRNRNRHSLGLPRPQHREQSYDDRILEALDRLDHRSVPKPEVFDITSGQPFLKFLDTFEDFCQYTYKGGSALWVTELGRYLTGEIAQAFSALRVAGDSYETVRHKLVQWVNDSRETYETEAKSRFNKAKRYIDEPLRLYAARIEKAFRLTYPKRQVESSSTLRKKYCETIPRSLYKQIQTFSSIRRSMGDKDIKWSKILELASQCDAERECSDTDVEMIPSKAIHFSRYQEPSNITRYDCCVGAQQEYDYSSSPNVYYSSQLEHRNPTKQHGSTFDHGRSSHKPSPVCQVETDTSSQGSHLNSTGPSLGRI